MNQQINLYLPEFRVRKDPVTAVLMGQILGGVILIMMLASGYQLMSRWRMNSELGQLRATLQEETQKTDELNEILARRSQNTELDQRLEDAEDRLQSLRQIRDFLNRTQLGNVIGFSEYFKDLSRAAIDGLSLTEFTINGGGAVVTIAGQTIDSAMVPQYVSNLEMGSSSLRNLNFSSSISRSDPGAQFFSFSLSSTNE